MKKLNEEKTYLAFKLSGFSYAIELENVLKIIDHKAVTPNPYKHNFFMGEININEYYLPVFNFKERLKIPNTASGETVIVSKFNINNECYEVGILADNLLPIVTIPTDCIIPSYNLNITPGSSFVNSIAKLNKDYYFILHTSSVFNNNDLSLIKTLNNERLVDQQIYA